MLRRSRISVRPNVRPNPSAAGRTVPAQPVSQDAPVPQPVSQDAPGPLPISQEMPQIKQEARCETSEDHSVAAVVTDGSPGSPLGKSSVPRDASDAGGEGTSPSAGRRKRFSIKPKVAPALNRARAPKSPVRTAVPEGPCSDSQDVTASSQTDATLSQGTTSPSQQRMLSGGLSGGDTRPTTPLVPAEDDNSTNSWLEKSQLLELSPTSQAKDVPRKPPNRHRTVPPCPSDKEAIVMSEKAKTLVSRSAKGGLPPPQDQFSLSSLLNDSSDLQKLEKARKLKKLLKKEMNKDKVKKKMKNMTSKAKYTPDPAKMTMRDLIYYLPDSNPMSSYLAESQSKNVDEIVVQPSPKRAPNPAPSSRQAGEDDDGDDQQEGEDGEEDDDQMMVPRVKVAEDGSLIIDEESLTVEVEKAKGPNPADGKDPVFERGSTTTYSSFRKDHYTKPWSTEETEMFFLAISMVGTDFSMICQLFPHRDRKQIKHKFKKEKKENSWRLDKVFKETRKLDIEVFSKLLDRVLRVQKCKKLKENKTFPRQCKKPKSSPSEVKTTRKPSRKTKGKTAEKKMSDVEEEEEEEEEENGGADMEEMEGENEDVSDERAAPASPPRTRKCKKEDDDESTEKPNENKTFPRQCKKPKSSPSEEKTTRKRSGKTKGKKMSDVEEENGGADMEEVDERAAPASPPRTRKCKKEDDVESTEKPNENKTFPRQWSGSSVNLGENKTFPRQWSGSSVNLGENNQNRLFPPP